MAQLFAVMVTTIKGLITDHCANMIPESKIIQFAVLQKCDLTHPSGSVGSAIEGQHLTPHLCFVQDLPLLHILLHVIVFFAEALQGIFTVVVPHLHFI
jgi:hypothetical protein